MKKLIYSNSTGNAGHFPLVYYIVGRVYNVALHLTRTNATVLVRVNSHVDSPVSKMQIYM